MTQRPFHLHVKRAAINRSGGICECHRLMPIRGINPHGCNQPLIWGRIRFEHIVCDGIGGEPTLENCAVLRIECWRIKTDAYDQGMVAKTKRQAAKHTGTFRPSRHPMPGGRESKWKKPMRGRTELR